MSRNNITMICWKMNTQLTSDWLFIFLYDPDAMIFFHVDPRIFQILKFERFHVAPTQLFSESWVSSENCDSQVKEEPHNHLSFFFFKLLLTCSGFKVLSNSKLLSFIELFPNIDTVFSPTCNVKSCHYGATLLTFTEIWHWINMWYVYCHCFF